MAAYSDDEEDEAVSGDEEEVQEEEEEEEWKAPFVDWNKPVMGRYEVKRHEILGSGSFSVVRKGTDLQTGLTVAVKTYKAANKDTWATTLVSFENQVNLLLKLQKNLGPDELVRLDEEIVDADEATIEASELFEWEMKDLFVNLLNYSTTPEGRPGPHPEDGMLYIVMELAECTLQDYIEEVKEGTHQMSKRDAQKISHSLCSMIASLHAKGFVHLDIKSENVMRFQGKWKLIDVDGSVPTGTEISPEDDSVAFTPIYCCPSFAEFCLGRDDSATQIIEPAMDVFSVGLTLLELCIDEPLLKGTFERICEDTGGDVFAYFSFLSDLSQALDLPPEVKAFDNDFYDLVKVWMLDKRSPMRRSCFQCLNHPFFGKQLSDMEPCFHKAERQRSSLYQEKQKAKAEEKKEIELECLMLQDGGDPLALTAWISVKIRLAVVYGTWTIVNAESEEEVQSMIEYKQLDGASIKRVPESKSAKACPIEINVQGKKILLSLGKRETRNTWVNNLKQAAAGGAGVGGKKDGKKRNALKKTNMKKMKAQMKTSAAHHFKTRDRHGHMHYYAWLDTAAADEMGLGVDKSHTGRFSKEDKSSGKIDKGKLQTESTETTYNNAKQWTEDGLIDALERHGIDHTLYGQDEARSIPELVKELNNGDSYFQTVDDQLVRLFDAVIIKIEAPGGRILQELERELSDGRVVGDKQFPAAKRRPHEDVLDTALRILKDKVQMKPADVDISVESDLVWEEKESNSYPGLHTVVRKHIVRGKLLTLAYAEESEFTVAKSDGNKRYFAWHQDEKAKAKTSQTRNSTTSFLESLGFKEQLLKRSVEEIQHASVTETDVRAMLTQYGVDLQKFGTGEAKSIADLTDELVKGDSRLMIRKDDEAAGGYDNECPIVRVVDVVCLRLFSPNKKQLLVETWEIFNDGRTRSRGMYPGIKQLTDETVLSAVESLLADFCIPTDAVQINPQRNNFREESESPSYPGLKSVYNRRVLEAVIVTTDLEVLTQLGLVEGALPDSKNENRSSILATSVRSYGTQALHDDVSAMLIAGMQDSNR